MVLKERNNRLLYCKIKRQPLQPAGIRSIIHTQTHTHGNRREYTHAHTHGRAHTHARTIYKGLCQKSEYILLEKSYPRDRSRSLCLYSLFEGSRKGLIFSFVCVILSVEGLIVVKASLLFLASGIGATAR